MTSGVATLALKATAVFAVLVVMVLPSLGGLCPPPGPVPPPPSTLAPPPPDLPPPPASGPAPASTTPAQPIFCDTCIADCWKSCDISRRCVELCSLGAESCRPCNDHTLYNECQEICNRDCANCVQPPPPSSPPPPGPLAPSSSPPPPGPLAPTPPASGPALAPAPAEPIFCDVCRSDCWSECDIGRRCGQLCSLGEEECKPCNNGTVTKECDNTCKRNCANCVQPAGPIFCDVCFSDCRSECDIGGRCSQLCRLGGEACKPCNDGTFMKECDDTCKRNCANCVERPPPPPPPSPGSLYQGLTCDECSSKCSSTSLASIDEKCHDACFVCGDCRSRAFHDCKAKCSTCDCVDAPRRSCGGCSEFSCEPCKMGYEQSCKQSCTRDHDCTGCLE